jgi:hypothetical protein
MTVPAAARRVVAVLAAGAFAVALTGCGGSGSGAGASTSFAHESGKPAAQIFADVRSVVAAATSVHLAGHVGGQTSVAVDLHLSRTGGSGRVSASGLAFKVTRIGKAVYFTGNEGFYRRFTNAAGIRLLDGRWLKVPATDRRFGPFTGLTDMSGLLGQLLHPSGTVTKIGSRTIAGQRAIGLRDSANGGVLYVAASGVPYPLEIRSTGSRAGTVEFDHWNQRITLTAPPRPLYLAQLRHAGALAS